MKKVQKVKVGIIGFGRFGKLLAEILSDDFTVSVLVRDNRNEKLEKYSVGSNIEDFYKTNDVVFFAVPIVAFESVILDHKRYFRKGQTLIDVLSVKLHAKKVFDENLPPFVEAILTHPMFGPDSVKANGLPGLPFIIDRYKSSEQNYKFWKDYLTDKGFNVIEMSADEHDRLAAGSQGVTHFIGRLLNEIEFKPTSIDTVGAKKLYEVMDQTCHDTWELFIGLQNYNPYTKQLRLNIGNAYDKIYNKLLPAQVDKDFITVGIQGGEGSFNEQAINEYVVKHNIKNYKVVYLYTSEKVLKNLHSGDIDLGLFAIHNSVGGIVTESVQAMARYKFQIVEEFSIKIRHFLMKRKYTDIKDAKIVMAHDQVFKQCKSNMKKYFPNLTQITGEGDLQDTARAAKALSDGELDNHTLILGHQNLAKLYDLDIIKEDLQDIVENFTSFLLVKRI